MVVNVAGLEFLQRVARTRSLSRASLTAAGTLQIPFPSEAMWKERMECPPEGVKHLVALIDGTVVGNLGLMTNAKSRRRHAGGLGMAVHDD